MAYSHSDTSHARVEEICFTTTAFVWRSPDVAPRAECIAGRFLDILLWLDPLMRFYPTGFVITDYLSLVLMAVEDSHRKQFFSAVAGRG